MSDIHALSGAYAADALDDLERARFERHLAECAECRAEVASFRETTALLATTTTERPPDSLRSAVLTGISQVRPLPPESAPASAPGPAVRRRRVVQLLAAAAAVVLLAVGALTWHPWQHDHTTLADRILAAPDAARVIQDLPGGAKLTLVRSASLKRAVMIGEHVPQPAPGMTYELWLQQPGKGFVPAGLMPDAEQPTVLTGDVTTATAAAVSVEPESGSSHPTSAPVAVFPLTSG
jgi:anti-sigma-K factor RskA